MPSLEKLLGSQTVRVTFKRNQMLAPAQTQRAVHNASAMVSTIDAGPDLNALFSYTTGRWLWNEEEQFAKRYRKFDVDALVRAGAAAAGAASCVEMEKLVEGNFNKVFLLRMDDGKEIVAKLPNPNAGRPHFLTASEVATMDYVRNVLEIPAPKILGWCSHADDTAVGAEYVFMEKAQGRPLSEHWPSLSGKERAKIAQQLADFDSKFALSQFPSYGSLYHLSETMPQRVSVSDSKIVSGRFIVGPSTERTWFDNRRADVDPDCGPWRMAEQYFMAIIDREIACINKFGMSGRLQGLFNPNISSLFKPAASHKLAILSQCRVVLEPLLASQKLDCTSTMWHPDLHSDNIFVDPAEPTRITAIIDWQAVNLRPRFLQVRNPSLLDVDEPFSDGLQLPKLPEKFDEMSEAEQLESKRIRDSQLLLRIWEIALCRNTPDAYHTLRMRETLRAQILGIMGSIFDDGDPVLEGYLIALQGHWEAATSRPDGRFTSCPLVYDDDDRARHSEGMEKWQQGVAIRHQIADALGVPSGWDGAVSHAGYDEMKQRLDRTRQDFLADVASSQRERLDWEKAWPFGSMSGVM